MNTNQHIFPWRSYKQTHLKHYPDSITTTTAFNEHKAHNSKMVQTKHDTNKALALDLMTIKEEPVEGFLVKLVNDDNMFEWEVAIFGPPETIYQGAYFKARMSFPNDYPYSPPKFHFITKVWHPNVYEDGNLCISILHSPIHDPLSGELSSERWNPTQSVRTILLSVVSLLNEPNISSPANVEASVMFRHWKESKGQDKRYEDIVRKQVEASKLEAERDGVHVPTTIEEYCIKPLPVFNIDFQNYGDDDYVCVLSDEDNESEEEEEDDDDEEFYNEIDEL